jgi:L,D-transpeptidase ErfK/SrfK
MNAFVAATALFLAQLVGSEFTYNVQAGDSLTGLSSRFGVEARALAAANGLDASSLLQIGQILTIDNRHIVPDVEDVEIAINIPQRMLFLFADGPWPRGYPIAAGKPTWKTPIADFVVVTKETDPTWDVPVSIQEEMRRSGKPVVTKVPPSAANPLGEYWIGLSLPAVGIHGTNVPSSIYSLGTHGCIRLHPDSIRALFPEVTVGMTGRIIYEPILIARFVNSVFIEVHPDAYKRVAAPMMVLMERARSEGLVSMMDLDLVEEVVRKREGIARDVTRR